MFAIKALWKKFIFINAEIQTTWKLKHYSSSENIILTVIIPLL